MPYQNGTQWEIWVCRDDGSPLGVLDSVSGFTFTLVVNNIGHWRVSVNLPASLPMLGAGQFASAPPAIQRSWFAKDRRLLFWRKPPTGAMKLAYAGLIRRIRTASNSRGLTTFVVSGQDLNSLLRRRIVAYPAASDEASKTDQADDLITEVVSENLGPDAIAARQISSAYFTIAASPSAAPSITKGFAYRNVLDVCREVAEASREAGTFLFFGIKATGESAFEFSTRTGEWGRDRTSDVGNGLIFGQEFGNMSSPLLDEDATEEVNFAYALGRGEEDERDVQTSEDTARSGASIYARAEAAANAVQQVTSAGVLDEADARVQKGRPVLAFTAKLLSVPGSEYGKDFEHGDRITAAYDGRQFDCLIRATTVTVNETGMEEIDPVIEALA